MSGEAELVAGVEEAVPVGVQAEPVEELEEEHQEGQLQQEPEQLEEAGQAEGATDSAAAEEAGTGGKGYVMLRGLPFQSTEEEVLEWLAGGCLWW